MEGERVGAINEVLIEVPRFSEIDRPRVAVSNKGQEGFAIFGVDGESRTICESGNRATEHWKDCQVWGFKLKVLDERRSFEESGGPEWGSEPVLRMSECPRCGRSEIFSPMELR